MENMARKIGDVIGETEPNNKLHEDFVFKDEIFNRFDEEKNKCIRTILWTAEVIIKDKESEDYKKLRKSVLDSVNDFCRRIQSLSEKVM